MTSHRRPPRTVGGRGHTGAVPIEQLSRAQARRVALVAQGFRDPPPHHADDAHLRAHPGAHGCAPGRLGQRAPARALHAAVLPHGSLRHRACSRGPPSAAAPDGGVLGARPGLHAGRAVAGDAAPHGGLPHQPAVGRLAADQPAARRAGPRPGARARCLDRARPRRRQPAPARSTGGGTGPRRRKALDYLFLVGDLAIAGRNQHFEPVYDVPERVLPPAVLGRRRRTKDEATKELVRRGRRSHGVATTRCLADYYRLQLQRGDGTARRAARRRRAGRGGRAAAGHDRGLEAAGLPPPRRRAAAHGATPAPC